MTAMAEQSEDSTPQAVNVVPLRSARLYRMRDDAMQTSLGQMRPHVHLAQDHGWASALADVQEACISNEMFYGEYHGHTVEHLQLLVTALREQSAARSVIFLCGGSSLDNKYWLPVERRHAVNGYERVLVPPLCAPDIAYWLNKASVDSDVGNQFCAVNASVDQSTLADRQGDRLLPQDMFIRTNMQEQDILVVSIGGNDVAFRPSSTTVASMASLLASPRWLIRQHRAPGFHHVVSLFRDETRRLIQKVIAQRKPRYIVVCMCYYPDEAADGSWADRALSLLGYNRDPAKLQLVMREVFAAATCQIRVEGVPVLPLPLYEALDGKNSYDYEQRVEPSVQGGQKIARAVLDRILAASALAC